MWMQIWRRRRRSRREPFVAHPQAGSGGSGCEDAEGSPVPGSKEARLLEHVMEAVATIIDLDQERRVQETCRVAAVHRERQVRPEVRGQGSTTRCSSPNCCWPQRSEEDRAQLDVSAEGGVVFRLVRAQRHSRGHGGCRSCRPLRDEPQHIQRGRPDQRPRFE